MDEKERQAIRERVEISLQLQNQNEKDRVLKEDVPKLLDEIDWQKKNVEGYRSNWHKAVHEIQQLRQERDELKAKNERLNKEIGRYSNAVFDFAKVCYENGDKAQQLVNTMLHKKEDSE